MVGGALILLAGLFFFGKTTAPGTPKTSDNQVNNTSSVTTKDLLNKAKTHLTPDQNARVAALENAVTRGDVKGDQMHVYHQLAKFWKDSAHVFEPYAYYTAEAAKLENSEKSLTFAAQLMVDNLLSESNPAMQQWLASQGKDLLEKALQINPNNDSSKISLGACYMLGNISGSPMQAILPVREIVQKNPDNLYAQMILGLGGKKSGQYDKAIERFSYIVSKQPNNLEAIFQLAECFDLKGDKADAIKWYTIAKGMIGNEQVQKEIEKRINELK
ncbi:MAG: tetratricopeptide repeat protein [Sphingobacteriia bacterium]|nr:tetratricopeptide repeat protein [Sphingobacteriia bacterium]